MKVIYKGVLVEEVLFCCPDMKWCVMFEHQIRVIPEGNVCVQLMPSKLRINYCPFCNNEVGYVEMV